MSDQPDRRPVYRLVNCARCGREFQHYQKYGEPYHPERCFCSRCGGENVTAGDALSRAMEEIERRAKSGKQKEWIREIRGQLMVDDGNGDA